MLIVVRQQTTVLKTREKLLPGPQSDDKPASKAVFLVDVYILSLGRDKN